MLEVENEGLRLWPFRPGLQCPGCVGLPGGRAERRPSGRTLTRMSGPNHLTVVHSQTTSLLKLGHNGKTPVNENDRPLLENLRLKYLRLLNLTQIL